MKKFKMICLDCNSIFKTEIKDKMVCKECRSKNCERYDKMIINNKKASVSQYTPDANRLQKIYNLIREKYPYLNDNQISVLMGFNNKNILDYKEYKELSNIYIQMKQGN